VFNHCHCCLDFVVEIGLKKAVSKTLIHKEMTQIVLETLVSFEANSFLTSVLKFLNFQPYGQSLFHSEEAL